MYALHCTSNTNDMTLQNCWNNTAVLWQQVVWCLKSEVLTSFIWMRGSVVMRCASILYPQKTNFSLRNEHLFILIIYCSEGVWSVQLCTPIVQATHDVRGHRSTNPVFCRLCMGSKTDFSSPWTVWPSECPVDLSITSSHYRYKSRTHLWSEEECCSEEVASFCKLRSFGGRFAGPVSCALPFLPCIHEEVSVTLLLLR